MRRHHFIPRIAVCLAALASSGIASAAVLIADPSFEKPLLPSGAYEYGVQNGAQSSSNGINARAVGVTFGNGAGVQSNGSAWGFASAPQGTQTAFLQSYGGSTPGKITETVTGLVPGQRYVISFFCANRPGYGVNPVTVSFGDSALGSFTPNATGWKEVTSDSFKATSAQGVITFSVAPQGGDADVGIDGISIAPAPAS